MVNDKSLFAIQCGLFVVGAQDEEAQLAGCIVDAFMQSTAYPPTAIFCSQHQTRTNVCIKATGKFSVSVLREDVDPFIVAHFGFQSSRHIQKWQHVAHTMQDGLPVLTNVAAWYVCKVVFTHELPTHTLFHCEFLHAEMGEGVALSYGYYRAHMRQATVAAFQEFKKHRRTERIEGSLN
jgi:flavin reductase (DIM6/NTAB) family NADH-FMN oxidoreductase RutF